MMLEVLSSVLSKKLTANRFLIYSLLGKRALFNQLASIESLLPWLTNTRLVIGARSLRCLNCLDIILIFAW